MSLFLGPDKKKKTGLIQPDVKHRNVDFIVSFGLLDEHMQSTLPRLLGVVFPLMCFAFHARVFSLLCAADEVESRLHLQVL